MSSKKTYQGNRQALLLTGGGARAAYQVGVLSAITRFMPRNHGIPFPIICGTSAGAINATAMACYASCFHLGVKKLEWVWKNLRTKNVYQSDAWGAFGYLGSGILASFQADYSIKRAHSLLNNAPLRELLKKVFDFKRIDDNILRGYLTAISVTASSYTTGDSISFFQSANSIEPWQRAKRKGKPCQINTEHLMASAAIPLVFPSISIDGEHFGDGSIHQLSPLSPAIHLGAEKILIIGVDQPHQPLFSLENNPHPPTSSTIAGHMLDSVFADTLQSDLERLARVNESLALMQSHGIESPHGLKQVKTLLINPSQDFNAIAVEHFNELPISVRMLLRSVGITNDSESSLISYLLFENTFTKKLMKIGYQDGLAKEQELRAFLNI
ncbi:patatin-like phospholipase family protein [Thalassotalea sp. LPB0316]|uniref:patatin-like phospholipase family protein n=1 Tax=Thalassotalea sp. LPB0316 TaxID=2769490 RepID=UPI0018687735|nr:patatin-like phospholipase family protein [Thalassotalea sp. LPB0316]QOL24704.1 patatin-like phospholipase family protein [Thalassotalea sp. LPB0316]